VNRRQQADARGRRAERLAAWYLRLCGWRIVARRRQLPMIEIDIVALKGQVLALVEVKYRPTMEQALAALTPAAAARLQGAAAQLAAERMAHGKSCAARVDLIALAPGRFPRHIQGVA
jgi:putative endonuclease